MSISQSGGNITNNESGLSQRIEIVKNIDNFDTVYTNTTTTNNDINTQNETTNANTTTEISGKYLDTDINETDKVTLDTDTTEELKTDVDKNIETTDTNEHDKNITSQFTNPTLQDTEQITNESNITPSIITENTLLAGGASNKIPIKFLAPEDNELINEDLIYKKVNTYIDNYYSTEYTNYKKLFNQIYQKYSKKQYIIQNTTHKITVIKNNGAIQPFSVPSKTLSKTLSKTTSKTPSKKIDIVMELNKPTYIHYSLDIFINLAREISNARANLKFTYDDLLSKLDVSTEDKKQFEKDKAIFINLLDKYYIYQIYHSKINQINTINTDNILIQNLAEYLKENGEESQVIMENELFKIDKSLIDSINNFNSNKLNEFNDIINNLQTQLYHQDISSKSILHGQHKDKHESKIQTENIKKLKDKIITYLDKKELNILYDNIKKTSKTQENYIFYIIETLPHIENN